MTIPVQKTLTITVDDGVYTVEKMSSHIKETVVLMDAWRQREVDASVELSMVRAALRDIQNQLLVMIRKEREEAMAKAQAMGLVAQPQPANDSGENDAA